MPSPSLFGQRLRARREALALTQEQLARSANCHATEVSNYESGARKSASVGTVVRLARALTVSCDYLLGNDPQDSHLTVSDR